MSLFLRESDQTNMNQCTKWHKKHVSINVPKKKILHDENDVFNNVQLFISKQDLHNLTENEYTSSASYCFRYGHLFQTII